MGIMFMMEMVQILIATVAFADCNRNSILSNTLCQVNQYVYYIHTFAVLIVSVRPNYFSTAKC